MKKIIVLFAVLALTLGSAQAQTASSPARDTLNTAASADTVDLYSPARYFAGGDGTFSVGVTATKLSGTVNAVAILQSTVDGVNFTDHYGTSVDSITLTNADAAYKWYVTGAKPARVRVRIIAPSSTQSVAFKGYFIKN